MDPALRQRLDVFRAMDEIPDGIVDFVADELNQIDPRSALDDDRAGMFVSHSVMALARLAKQDDSVTEPSDAVYDQVVREQPAAPIAARALAARIQARFGAALPDSEVKFLTIHLALLAQHLSKEI